MLFRNGPKLLDSSDPLVSVSWADYKDKCHKERFYVFGWAWVCVPQCAHGGQRAASRSVYKPYSVWNRVSLSFLSVLHARLAGPCSPVLGFSWLYSHILGGVTGLQTTVLCLWHLAFCLFLTWSWGFLAQAFITCSVNDLYHLSHFPDD